MRRSRRKGQGREHTPATLGGPGWKGQPPAEAKS